MRVSWLLDQLAENHLVVCRSPEIVPQVRSSVSLQEMICLAPLFGELRGRETELRVCNWFLELLLGEGRIVVVPSSFLISGELILDACRFRERRLFIFLPSLPNQDIRPHRRLPVRDNQESSLEGHRTSLSRLPRSEHFGHDDLAELHDRLERIGPDPCPECRCRYGRPSQACSERRRLRRERHQPPARPSAKPLLPLPAMLLRATGIVT